MKKILLAVALLTASTVSMAHEGFHGGYGGGHYYHGGGGGWGWVAPGLIDGVIGYELAQPRVVVQQPPVVIQQPPVVYQQPQVIQPQAGTPIYQWQTIHDDTCNCNKQVLVRIN